MDVGHGAHSALLRTVRDEPRRPNRARPPGFGAARHDHPPVP
jgi:hypothetical protein